MVTQLLDSWWSGSWPPVFKILKCPWENTEPQLVCDYNKVGAEQTD